MCVCVCLSDEIGHLLSLTVVSHFAAKLDGITIDSSQIIEPKTENNLVIEGAGGILVPLNSTDCIIDIIKPDYKVIIVSRHYLGSINHTILTIEALQNRKINIAGIIRDHQMIPPIVGRENGIRFWLRPLCIGNNETNVSLGSHINHVSIRRVDRCFINQSLAQTRVFWIKP